MDAKKPISIIFSTPLFAVYLHLILSIFLRGYLPNTFLRPIIFVLGLVFLSIIPISPVLWDSYKGRTDVFVSERAQRPKYFLFAIVMYLIGFVLAYLLKASLMGLFLLCYATVTTSLFLINFYTKVSVHVAGVAGPLTYVVLFLGGFWTLLYLLVPVVAWERIASKAHTKTQVLIAVIDSIVVTVLTVKVAIIFL